MKKLVLKLNIHDDDDKRRAMKAVSSVKGIDSIQVDLKEGKMTLIGVIDPVKVVSKLRKGWSPSLIFVGPAKEEKKEEPKKEEAKKEEPAKKEESSGGGGGEDKKKQVLLEAYNTQLSMPPYYYPSLEENPNACVIC